jgi:hypothetical protein
MQNINKTERKSLLFNPNNVYKIQIIGQIQL